MKYASKRQRRSRAAWLVISGWLLVMAAMPAVAGASSQSFNVLNNQAQSGMLMSLTANAGVIEPATTKNASSLIGVIATDNASLSQQPGQTSVATDGQASTLVSTLNGDIKVGDRIGPSSLSGVGDKLTASGWMVGVAEASLDSKTTGAVATSLSDTQGSKHTVYVARIPVIVKVNYYNAASPAPASARVPDGLQALADKIAGKHASTLALVLSFILLLTGIIWAGLVIYAAVKGSLDAIARQPLSKYVINRAMIRSLGLALVVIGGVLAGSLLLLRVL